MPIATISGESISFPQNPVGWRPLTMMLADAIGASMNEGWICQENKPFSTLGDILRTYTFDEGEVRDFVLIPNDGYGILQFWAEKRLVV